MSTHAILRGRSPLLAHALRTSAKTNSLVTIGVRPRFAEAFLDLSCSASLGLRRAIQYPASAKETYVVTNNHFRGQAIVNAVELEESLGMDAKMPPQLKETYPGRA